VGYKKLKFMPKFSIIIPVCGNQEMTTNCVNRIRACSTDFEIILVDNGSQPKIQSQYKCLRQEENLGFPKAVNIGIKEATGEIIVILNNDTLVTPQWLDRLAEHLKYADMVGPVTNSISGPQRIAYHQVFDSEKIDFDSEDLYQKNKLQSTPWHRLVFFCVAIKREVIDKIGLLDEQFSPGNFEDDDFCLRAVGAGFHLVIAEDVFIYHYGSQTHKSLNLDYAKLLETNRAKFEAKWPAEKQAELRQKAQAPCLTISNQKTPTLALVMVVKNEEKGLAAAVNSAKSICDEIIILVDSSSTDRTLQIARQLTPEVHSFEYHDDFARARNLAHLGVKSDWILFLDGHEILKTPETVKKYLTCPEEGLLSHVLMETGTKFPAVRIYRKGCEFNGALHEQINCKTTKCAPDILIEHHRLDLQSDKGIEERERQREEQTPRILGGQLKKDKKNTRAAFHMAKFYEGQRNWKKALKYQKLYLKHSDVPGGRWFILYSMAQNFFEQKKYFRAWMATVDAVAINPFRWEISELRGLIFFAQKNWEKAAEYLVESFNENRGDISFLPKEKDIPSTWNLIGECLVNQGEFQKASEAFRRGKQTCKHPEFKKLLERRMNWSLQCAKEIAINKN